ncbi:PAS domain S-box protein [Priestia megaterium]|nr:PAS domain S-box protein [Priestia megaterium]
MMTTKVRCSMNSKTVKLTQMMQIANHGHILYIYDAIDSYIENAVSYIMTGIEHGHHLLIIENKERYEQIYLKLQEALSHDQLDYIHYIDNYEFYRLYGDCHCESIVNHFTQIIKPFLSQQISFRTWAHVEWKEQDHITSKLEHFENIADQSVSSSGLVSICAYDGNKISALLQNTMLKSHEYLMTDNELVKSNLYQKRTVVFPSLSVQSDHKKVEKQLKAIKHQLESFIMQNSDPILILDKDDKLITINRAFERTFGWSADEVVGLNATDLPIIPDDKRFEVNRNRSFAILGENIEGCESVRKTRDGTILNMMLSCFPLRDEEDKVSGRAVIIRDISERKKAQELLIRTEKLSVAGELAAGIAHEIRNPITAIKGFLQLLQSGSIEKKAYYGIIAAEIDRIEQILSELLMLAKPQAINVESKNILSLIKDVVTLLDAQANMNNVQIIIKFDHSETCVRCEENQIKQVCINFIKNAMEAMPKGGKLVIQIKNVNEEKLLIRFIDQGCGIPKHLLSKLGQPFYTTKKKGTGLGFMVSKQIIENHNGTVVISSKENKGTTIEVSLPL